jgi:hypothetical protein
MGAFGNENEAKCSERCIHRGRLESFESITQGKITKLVFIRLGDEAIQ